MFTFINDLKTEDKKTLGSALISIEKVVSIDTVSFSIDEKNPGQDSYSSNGGGAGTTYNVSGDLNPFEREIFTVLASTQQSLDTTKHYLISGFITKVQYAERKQNTISTADLLLTNMIKLHKK